MALNASTRNEELTNILQHYTSALRALQEAIDNNVQRITAETLCAAELMGIFKVNSVLFSTAGADASRYILI